MSTLITQTSLPTIIVAIVAVFGSLSAIVASAISAHNNTINQRTLLKIEKAKDEQGIRDVRVRLIRKSYANVMGDCNKAYNLNVMYTEVRQDKSIEEGDRNKRMEQLYCQAVQAESDLLKSKAALQIEVDENIARLLDPICDAATRGIRPPPEMSNNLQRAVTDYLRQQEASIKESDYTI